MMKADKELIASGLDEFSRREKEKVYKDGDGTFHRIEAFCVELMQKQL